MLFLALSFFAPMLAVFLMISYLLPDFRHRILLKLSLSVGLAFGLTSCTFFIWLNLFGPPETPYLIAETSLLLITALIFGYAGRHKTDIAREDAVPLADRNTYYVLLATFGFTNIYICRMGLGMLGQSGISGQGLFSEDGSGGRNFFLITKIIRIWIIP